MPVLTQPCSRENHICLFTGTGTANFQTKLLNFPIIRMTFKEKYCENLEVGDYVVGFRRLASTQNLTHA